MSFCSHCGTQYEDGAKFCSNCGKSLLSGNLTQNHDAQNSGKIPISNQLGKTIANDIYCPNCHHPLKAFMTQCPSCGCELRNKISSLKEFKIQYDTAVSDKQKIDLIRTYIIPNTREDIIEFAIYASSNINAQVYAGGIRDNPQIEFTEAWITKFEQAYQKAKLILAGDTYLQELEAIQSKKTEEIKKAKKEGQFANKKRKNKIVTLLLCCFLGVFGAHKFYEGKIGLGILFLFTYGLFFIGWVVDLFKCIISIVTPPVKMDYYVK